MLSMLFPWQFYVSLSLNLNLAAIFGLLLLSSRYELPLVKECERHNATSFYKF